MGEQGKEEVSEGRRGTREMKEEGNEGRRERERVKERVMKRR